MSSTRYQADHTGNVAELTPDVNGREAWPLSEIHWLPVAPTGFRNLLNRRWDRYNDLIILTENGCVCSGEYNIKVEAAVRDTFRSRYTGLYMDLISRAIYEDGVNVQGYYASSLMDNFGRLIPVSLLRLVIIFVFFHSNVYHRMVTRV